jgi:hypothetical protein
MKNTHSSGKSNNSKLNLGFFSQDAIDLEVAKVVIVHTAVLITHQQE